MKIPVYSSTIRRSEMDAVLTCMVEEKIGPGEANQKLIRLIKDSFQVEGAATFRSPAIALAYALRALGLEPGSGVLLSVLAPAWQFTEVQRQGFTPILVDVDAETALMTPSLIADGIQAGGKVVVLHEALGNLPNMQEVLSLNIPVIEDISQSAGAELGEKKAGCFGVFAILGLEERDILTAGGGAALLSAERRNALVLKKLYDVAPPTDILPDINASLAFVQLKQMEKNMQLRQELYELYVRFLMQGRHKTIAPAEGLKNPVYSFPVLLSSGYKDVKQFANKKGVETEPAFSGSIIDTFEKQEEYIQAASLLLRCVLFPLYPRLGMANAEKISKVLRSLP
ncbi:DegT/DnrJ/EryC1/StrS family aminotransferase [Treponema phagedenis]|uniref:DegT/DnrJ/EryC1/StrS family aminotransferase n=1 Tax=Treponema phagedenis TaxID=162 RepID=UPI000586BF13|nr:DegT/DnrJ/EryC1/StrS family aminotransferase [Treponema phagedenis]TYT77957.1 DegT/DnrJ/EryC1/StrS aminotransferase family protein [Treponema phagedenis]